MKIISVHARQNEIRRADAELSGRLMKDGLGIHILRTFRTGTLLVRFAGASLTVADTGRNVGKAALGAVAGGVLLGPLGAIAGGVFGGAKSHTLVLHSPDGRVVFEASTDEYQQLLGMGLPTGEGPVEIVRERLPDLPLRWWVKPGAVFAAVLALIAVTRRGDDAPPPSLGDAVPSVQSSGVRAEPTPVQAKTPAKPKKPAERAKQPPNKANPVAAK